MCPQIHLLVKLNMFQQMRILILDALSNLPESSHEIKNKMKNSPLINQLEIALQNYPESGFKETASFVGATCSVLAKQGLIKHTMKTCPITKNFNDAFCI